MNNIIYTVYNSIIYNIYLINYIIMGVIKGSCIPPNLYLISPENLWSYTAGIALTAYTSAPCLRLWGRRRIQIKQSNKSCFWSVGGRAQHAYRKIKGWKGPLQTVSKYVSSKYHINFHSYTVTLPRAPKAQKTGI